MKGTLLIAASIVALAGVAAIPSASAAETYQGRIAECGGLGVDFQPTCFVGVPPEDGQCSLVDSIVQTNPLGNDQPHNVVGCLT